MDKFDNDEYNEVETESNKSITQINIKKSNVNLISIQDENSFWNMSSTNIEEKALLSSRMKRKETENKEWDKFYK